MVDAARDREVGVWPDSFDAMASGSLLHDLRRECTPPFRQHEALTYVERDPVTDLPTGRRLRRRVTYVTSRSNRCALSDEGLAPSFVVLSLAPIHDESLDAAIPAPTDDIERR